MYYTKRQQRNFWRKERERYLYLLGQSVAKSAIIKFKKLIKICDTTLQELGGLQWK